MRSEPLPAGRRAVALAAGALLASLAWSLWFFAGAEQFEPAMPLVLLVAFIVWLGGAMMFGLPLWAWFERKGWASVGHAILLGFALGFLVSLALQSDGFGLFHAPLPPGSHSSYGDGGGTIAQDGVLTAYGWRVVVAGALRIGACSALGAIATWWLARRTTG